MHNKKTIYASVHELIEYSLQSGDLTAGGYSASRAVEGTRGHSAVRKQVKERLSDNDTYEAELPVVFRLEGSTLQLEVNGRIDGLLKDASGVTIHEIKTTTHPLEHIEHDHNLLHWAQAKCYAYMLSHMYSLDYVAIRLTYFQLDDKQEKSFIDLYSFDSLEAFFMPLVNDYMAWQETVHGWNISRDSSINGLAFPYTTYRQGQLELIENVYDTIENTDVLFAQAPTGTGKTIASLYPAIKALGDGLISKVFYLTAKTTTRSLAEKSLADMRQKGLRIKSITITAKEKACLCHEKICNTEMCEYTINYYGKIKKVMAEALEEDTLDRETIESYARKHTVCPFELSLDLSLFCDVIICDYNYLFDPRVYLKRYFTKKGSYCFLVDEAHNLVDRARDMYSAELSQRSFFRLKKAAKDELPDIYDALDRIYRYFLDTSKSMIQDENNQEKGFYHVMRERPDELQRLLEGFTGILDNWLTRNPPVSFMETLLEIYYDCLHFINISQLYDDRHVVCFDKSTADFKIKLFCIDPSSLLQDTMNKGRASILFSATLSPMSYFMGMLSDGEGRSLAIPSPFLSENLCVYVDDSISTKYKTRQFSYESIAKAVLETVTAKTGNYIVFFPSFRYLNEVYYRFMEISQGIQTLFQTPGMSEAARQDFLLNFENVGESSLVGFAVMGGVFAEGIDLTGDKLSGAIIVGVGLPQICNERNIIRQYFDEKYGSGFEYAYIYPGLNRVLQAAGRVIRTEEDMGVVILLDERFSYHVYRELLPPEWSPVPRASDGYALTEILSNFWK